MWLGFMCFSLGKQTHSPTHHRSETSAHTQPTGTQKKLLLLPRCSPVKGNRASSTGRDFHFHISSSVPRPCTACLCLSRPPTYHLTNLSIFVRRRAGLSLARACFSSIHCAGFRAHAADLMKLFSRWHLGSSKTKTRMDDTRYTETCAEPMQNKCVFPP